MQLLIGGIYLTQYTVMPSLVSCVVSFTISQTKDNQLIMSTMKIHSGVCLHNGIVYKDRDEWTVDACTECTCQVSTCPLHSSARNCKRLSFMANQPL